MNDSTNNIDISSMLLKEFSGHRLASMVGHEINKLPGTDVYEASALYGLEDAQKGNYVFLIDIKKLKIILEKREDDTEGNYNFYCLDTETGILVKNKQPIQNHQVFTKIIKDFFIRNSKTERLTIKLKKN